MNLIKTLALVTAVALTPAFALAQPTPAPGATPNATTPKARGEHKGGKGERFKKADTNGDGALSKAEVDAAGMKRLSAKFDKIDANRDGKITREEMKAARAAHKDEGKGLRRGADKAATPAAPAAPAAK